MRRAGIRDAGEVGAGRDLLSDVDRDDLQDTVQARAHLQLAVLPLFQLQHGARLIDGGLLHRNLRAARFGARVELLLRNFPPHVQLLFVELRLPQRQFRDELFLGERLVHFELHARLVVIRIDARGARALLEQIVLHLHAQIGERRFG